MLSRKASCNSHGQDSSYFIGWQEYDKNRYHQLDNPSGIIQMGLAENQLSFDLIEHWLATNPDALGLKRGNEFMFRELALFQDYHGLPTLKQALVRFMAEIRGNKVNFDPNKLVLTAGSTSASETLMFCLAERGDAFLLPTPYYPGFDRDLKWRTEVCWVLSQKRLEDVEIVPIQCSRKNEFRITKPALKKAYEHAEKLGLNVKGIFITNPSNPLGTSLTTDELNHIITFAVAKNIHVISDEVYSGTVFDNPGFRSITEALIDRNLKDTKIWNRIHIVYSLSKDLGVPGFRIGMIYSNNDKVVSTATKMSSFSLVSSQTQYLMDNMLRDEIFMRKFLEENKSRLRRRKEMLVSGLGEAGIGCLRSNSGLFCWVDLRHLLKSETFEAEKELWIEVLHGVGISISPGSSCHCSEPGWFRICFANMSQETLNVALRRIKNWVDRKSASKMWACDEEPNR